MLTLADFFDVVRSSVPQFKTKWLDRDQERVVSAPPDPPALPGLVGGVRLVPNDQVGRSGHRVVVRAGGAPEMALPVRFEAPLAHQPLDALAAHAQASGAHFRVHPRGAEARA